MDVARTLKWKNWLEVIGITSLLSVVISVAFEHWWTREAASLQYIVLEPASFDGKSSFGIVQIEIKNVGNKEATDVVCLIDVPGVIQEATSNQPILEPHFEIEKTHCKVTIPDLPTGRDLRLSFHTVGGERPLDETTMKVDVHGKGNVRAARIFDDRPLWSYFLGLQRSILLFVLAVCVAIIVKVQDRVIADQKKTIARLVGEPIRGNS